MSQGRRTVAKRNLIQAINPALVNNTTASTGWVDARNCTHIFAFVAIGVTDTTVDAKLQKATSSGGAGVTDVSGAAITQLSATDDNKQASISIDPSELATGSYTHVRLLVTVGNGSTGAYVSGLLLMADRHMPPTQPTTYVEQVVL